jgi:MarR family transcriptional regulator, transcriptional regulator for hemolysin
MEFISKMHKPPLGKVFFIIARKYLGIVNEKLQGMEIERSFYALTLIGSSEKEITQQELAEMLGSDKVSIVRVIDYLSQIGYVKRTVSQTDRRKNILTLTPKALQNLPRIKSTLEEVNDIALKGLTEEELKLFEMIIGKITQNLRKES